MRLQQWEVVFNPKNSPNGEGIENIDPSPSNVNRSLQLIGRDDVIVGEVYVMLASSFKAVLLHINTKRIQVEQLEKDKVDPTKQTLQTNYAMAYQCMYQDEVLGALWSLEGMNLFTCALTYTRPTTTMAICTDCKSKDKFSNGTFLKYLYDNIIPKNNEVKEEIIWSDGPTSEFKNKYMCHLMDKFSTKSSQVKSNFISDIRIHDTFNKRFSRKFSLTSHGKGVVDGIGGNVKSIAQSQSLGKRKDKIIVQDAKSFY